MISMKDIGDGALDDLSIMFEPPDAIDFIF
jgi:hypothetical protein